MSMRLPAAAETLLETLQRRVGGVVRVWAPSSSGSWVRLYASNGDDRAAPGSGAAHETIRNGDGGDLRLEVEGGEPDPRELGIVADAIRRILEYEREAELAAKELAERYEEINLLYSISETLGSVLSLEAAAGRILLEVAELLGARRASLWVFDDDDQRLHLAAAVGDKGLTGPIALEDPISMTARVFRERQPINLEQGTELPRDARFEHKPLEREAFLSVPIQFTPPEGDSRTVGVITLVGRKTNVRFSAGDVRLLSAIASQVGAALETHRLMQQNVRQERVLREMELAHDLQMKLLPDTQHFQGPAEVAARCMPADQVGGDFYHLFRLSEDRLGVMIGDVSSHGFSAALIMALTMSAVAIYAPEAEQPAEVLRRVYEALADELQSTEMYMSLFYGVIDPGAERLVYANAGHPHAFKVAERGEPVRLGATNPPLGLAPLGDDMEREVPWRRRSDLLCLFTDGLSDAFSADGGVPGETELLRVLSEHRALQPAQVLDRIFAAAAERQQTRVPPDDRTAVLVRA